MDDRPFRILFDTDAPLSQRNCVAAEPLANSIDKHPMKITAVHRNLRPLVASQFPARLYINLLAQARIETKLLRQDALACELIFQTELRKIAHRMRQKIEAYAERFDLRSRFESSATHADLMKCKGKRAAADTTANDDDVQVSAFRQFDPACRPETT